MRAVLFATSAIVGLTLCAAGAQAAQPITVRLGGSFEFYSGWLDTDLAGQPSHDFRIDPEIKIDAKGVADNGLEYGVKWEIELETTPYFGANGRNIRSDEVFGFVAGSFGLVEFGDRDGAAPRLAVYAPVVGFGQLDSDYDAFVGNAVSNLGGAGFNNYFLAANSDDATKVSYYSPRMAGFQAGISYASDNAGRNEGDSVKVQPTTYNSFIEGGVNYEGEFSGVGVKASATISDFNCTACGAGLDDVTSWQVGAQISYAGFTLGGGVNDSGGLGYGPSYGSARAGSTKLEDGWNIGASYEIGRFSVAGQYGEVSTNRDGADFSAYGFGAAYALAPGLVLAGDVVIYDHDAIDADGNAANGVQTDDGYIVMIGTILSF